MSPARRHTSCCGHGGQVGKDVYYPLKVLITVWRCSHVLWFSVFSWQRIGRCWALKLLNNEFPETGQNKQAYPCFRVEKTKQHSAVKGVESVLELGLAQELLQSSFCIVPPTPIASGVICSKKPVLHHFVVDFTTVLTLDIYSRKMPTAFSCSASSLTRSLFLCTGRQSSLLWYFNTCIWCCRLTGKEKRVGGFDLIWNDGPVSRGGNLGALVNGNFVANTHLGMYSPNAGTVPCSRPFLNTRRAHPFHSRTREQGTSTLTGVQEGKKCFPNVDVSNWITAVLLKSNTQTWREQYCL